MVRESKPKRKREKRISFRKHFWFWHRGLFGEQKDSAAERRLSLHELTSQDSRVYSPISSPISVPSWDDELLEQAVDGDSSNIYLAGSPVVSPLGVVLDQFEAAHFQGFFVQVAVDVSNPWVEESVELIHPNIKSVIKISSQVPLINPHLFFGMLNQYSGRSLFFPYDITVVGSGVVLPICRPIRSRKYIGGSWQARAGLGISSRSCHWESIISREAWEINQ